jgi:nitrite reductase/ring-hydroxylating ferredoxin subunit
MQEHIVVAHIADIKPGHMLYADIDGLPIALANVDGTIYAFGDSCRHEGGPLSSGVLRDDVVTCPWHGWAYSVRIATYPVVIDGDRIVVVLDWPDEDIA